MDIDQLMYQAVSKNNDTNELKGFIQSQGARQSANEHLVPEQLFDDPNTKEKEVEGVSAVKAIQIAQEQGQTVYTITQENYSQIIPKLSLSSGVMTDIRDNVAVGRTVTVHEKTIHYKGWKGSGYIIIDPHTGSGAYLIDGGANGGYLTGDNASIISTLALAYTDSKTFLREKPWFSKSLLEKYKFSQVSKYIGLGGLLLNLAYIASKDDLSTNQKYFQVFTNMLGYALIANIGNAIMLATPLSIGIALSVVMALIISTSIILINDLYGFNIRIYRNKYNISSVLYNKEIVV
ncbi:hypothetical protein [Moraxella bovis]|uniref:Uncharacterized protein n=1 Tax=Moraxella bovis TaxID=476 RepID=A0A378PNH2_MORBO|nr:hypothetical protein [Moraxella bovis]STY90068.1 Uncharacterised protein [Moraxella bovis]